MAQLTSGVPTKGTPQHSFEAQAKKLGILPGTMVVHANQEEYLNPHVQWLWEQYLRKTQNAAPKTPGKFTVFGPTGLEMGSWPSKAQAREQRDSLDRKYGSMVHYIKVSE